MPSSEPTTSVTAWILQRLSDMADRTETRFDGLEAHVIRVEGKVTDLVTGQERAERERARRRETLVRWTKVIGGVIGGAVSLVLTLQAAGLLW